jgi:hypothetical protein
MSRVLCALGVLGGVFWAALAFYPPECAPVTEASEVLCNRLWTPGLLGMGLGLAGLFSAARPSLTRASRASFIALVAGLALMSLGNFVEYWLLSDLPHEGPEGFLRGLAWMTVLSGFLVVLIATAVVGGLALKLTFLPNWLGGLFVLLAPATLAAGYGGLQWAGLPLGVVCAAAGLAGLLKLSSRQTSLRGTK